jgi:tetratricopeptide (TPR) repeat protein
MLRRLWNIIAVSAITLGCAACASHTAIVPSANNPALSRTWSDRSTTFLAAGSPNEGVEAADQAIRFDAGNVTAWENKAVGLCGLRLWSEALPAAERALALQPKNAAALGKKALALSHLGRHDEALRAADRALTLEPKNAVLWYDRSRSEALKGDRAGALQSLATAVVLDPQLKSAAATEEDLMSISAAPDFKKLVNE